MRDIDKLIEKLTIARRHAVDGQLAFVASTIQEAIGTIKELSEKQIPKSSILSNGFMENMLECPKCKSHLGVKGFMSGELSNYCSNCGQRLNWAKGE